jgi:hypothetical protein
MNYLDNFIYWLKEQKSELISIILFVAFIYLLFSFNNSPVERFIKLSPEWRADRIEVLKNIDSRIATCKRLNQKYTPQKTYLKWYEDIHSYGEWYEPRLSNPIIRVAFNNREKKYEMNSYCEVSYDVSPKWDRYLFYSYYGDSGHIDYKCDDWGAIRCTK